MDRSVLHLPSSECRLSDLALLFISSPSVDLWVLLARSRFLCSLTVSSLTLSHFTEVLELPDDALVRLEATDIGLKEDAVDVVEPALQSQSCWPIGGWYRSRLSFLLLSTLHTS